MSLRIQIFFQIWWDVFFQIKSNKQSWACIDKSWQALCFEKQYLTSYGHVLKLYLVSLSCFLSSDDVFVQMNDVCDDLLDFWCLLCYSFRSISQIYLFIYQFIFAADVFSSSCRSIRSPFQLSLASRCRQTHTQCKTRRTSRHLQRNKVKQAARWGGGNTTGRACEQGSIQWQQATDVHQ